MTILSTYTASRIRNRSMGVLHLIAADESCEVSDILALLIPPSQPTDASQAPAARMPAAVPAVVQAEEPAPGFSADPSEGLIPPFLRSQAKASEDDGATDRGEITPDDSVTGDVSRASVGAGTDAPIQPETANSGEAPTETAAGESPVTRAAEDIGAQPEGGENVDPPTSQHTPGDDLSIESGQQAHAVTIVAAGDPAASDKSASATAPAAPDYLAQVRACLRKNPDWPARLIGHQLGITPQRVAMLAYKNSISLSTQPEYDAAQIKKRAAALAPALMPKPKAVAAKPPAVASVFQPKSTLERKVATLHSQHPTWTPSMVAKELGVGVDAVIGVLSRIRNGAPATVTAPKPEFEGRKDMLSHYAEVGKRLGKRS